MKRVLILLFFLGMPVIASSEPLAVIVNKNNPSSVLKKGTVADMYRGEEGRWSFGSKVTLVNREIGSAERREFYRTVLDSAPEAKYYRRGTPIAIQSIVQRSDEAVKQFVQQVESAIGYIPKSKVDDSVKIVLTVE